MRGVAVSSFVLDQGALWLGDGRALDGHLVVNGRDIEAAEAGRYRGRLPVVDLRGLSLSPGLIDLMVLGGFNRSILRDDPRTIAREYLRLGVTGCQLCIGTLPWDSMLRVADQARAGMNDPAPDAARILGLYLEGPFQQPDLTGASLRDYALAPTAENAQRILDGVGSALTMINVSPGLDGDAAAVRRFRQAGKAVSMAHSDAPAERVLACVEAGTAVLGHIWDNNSGRIGDSGVQQPTIEHVALTDDRIRHIHLICDGVHVDPVLVRLALRCRGLETLCLVTDAVIRAGCADGPFLWDDGRRFIKQGGVGRTDTGWLCGSGLLLPDHFRNFVKFTGVPPPQAVRVVTSNPAACMGRQEDFGLLAPGRAADLAAWDDRLRVRRVWRAGREIDGVSDYAEVALGA